MTEWEAAVAAVKVVVEDKVEAAAVAITTEVVAADPVAAAAPETTGEETKGACRADPHKWTNKNPPSRYQPPNAELLLAEVTFSFSFSFKIFYKKTPENLFKI